MLNEEMKMKLFNEMLKIETLANKKTYDNHDYTEQSNGAYAMLKALGIDREYIRWSEGKWANV